MILGRNGLQYVFTQRKPAIIRTLQDDGWLYCYVQGTGHRLSYKKSEDWIEVVWDTCPDCKSVFDWSDKGWGYTLSCRHGRVIK